LPPEPTWERLRAGEPSSQAINLLQGEFAPRASRLSVSRIPRAALVLAALIAILQLAFLAADTWRLERERVSLEAKREAVFRGAFPEAKTVVDPQLQMARNLAELKRARGMASDDDFPHAGDAGRARIPRPARFDRVRRRAPGGAPRSGAEAPGKAP
jgi:general secretion pathway protein L